MKVTIIVLVALMVLAVSCKRRETSPKLERELCAAADELDIDKAKRLIDRGVNVNTTVYGGYNPLALAILGGAPEMRVLGDKLILDPTSTTKSVQRLLMVRLLIDSGADVNGTASPILSESPLDYARLADDDKLLEEMLVSAGAKERAAPGIRKTIEANQVVNARGEIVTPSGKTISKAESKAMWVGVAKLLYHQKALEAADNTVEEMKRKIVEGK